MEKFSTITGTVIDYNKYGCYVRPDGSDEVVFYYGNGMKGDRVQLSVKRINHQHKSVTCLLDSVLEYGSFDYAA